MCRIVLMFTLLALGNAACSNSQTAGQPGYSDAEGKSLLDRGNALLLCLR